MDIDNIPAMASEMAQARAQQAAQLSVLKKAIDLQGQGAIQLVQAAAQAMPRNNPPHLGNRIDTFA